MSQGAAAARIRETTSFVVFGFGDFGFGFSCFLEEEERGDEGGEKTGRSGGRRPREAEKGAKEEEQEEEEEEFGEETSRAPTRSEASIS